MIPKMTLGQQNHLPMYTTTKAFTDCNWQVISYFSLYLDIPLCGRVIFSSSPPLSRNSPQLAPGMGAKEELTLTCYLVGAKEELILTCYLVNTNCS